MKEIVADLLTTKLCDLGLSEPLLTYEMGPVVAALRVGSRIGEMVVVKAPGM